jgi:phosphatidylglycerophosphate synthase
VHRVQAGPLNGFIGLLVLLGALSATVGLGAVGWLVGLSCGAGGAAWVTRGLVRQESAGLGAANAVTLTRGVLSCGVAALTADSLTRPAPVPTMVALATVALVLDAVDGRVARRTHTTSVFGARFDMEVDAFLILVLSIHVAAATGWWWVLAIGAARYLFVAAGVGLPWLRGSVPPRYWCKVVAALQGVVLTVAMADVLPRPAAVAALAVALLLLAESFGREVWRLWRARPAGEPAAGHPVIADRARDA